MSEEIEKFLIVPAEPTKDMCVAGAAAGNAAIAEEETEQRVAAACYKAMVLKESTPFSYEITENMLEVGVCALADALGKSESYENVVLCVYIAMLKETKRNRS